MGCNVGDFVESFSPFVQIGYFIGVELLRVVIADAFEKLVYSISRVIVRRV